MAYEIPEMLDFKAGSSKDVKCKNAQFCQILIIQDSPSTYELFGFTDLEDVFKNMAIAFMVIFFVFGILSWAYQKGYMKDLCRGKYGGSHQPTRQHRWEAEEAIDNRRVGEISMNPLARNANNNASAGASTSSTASPSSSMIGTGSSTKAWDSFEDDSNAPTPSAVARVDSSRARRDPFVARTIQDGGFSPGPQPKNNSNVPIIAIRPPKSPASGNATIPVPVHAATFSSSGSSNTSTSGDLLDLPNTNQRIPAMPPIAPAPSRSQQTLSREWTEKYSQQHKRKFWKNNVTGKSTWEDPFKRQSSAPTSTTTTVVTSDSQSSEPDLL